MAKVYKRDGGDTYWIAYSENGRFIRRSLGVTDKRVAEKMMSDIINRRERKEAGMLEKIRGDQAWQQYEETVVSMKSPGYKSNIHYHTLAFRRWVAEKKLDLVKLTAAEFGQYLAARVAEGRSANTIRNEWKQARLFYAWCIRMNFLAKNPTDGATLPTSSGEKVEGFTESELQLIWKHANSVQLPVVRFLYLTGLRSGELRNLEWGDVNWEAETVRVRSKADHRTKTVSSQREVPLDAEALQILRDCRKYQDEHSLKSLYCFTQHKGKNKGQKRESLVHLWRRLADKIKREEGVDLTGHNHCFRHSFATICLRTMHIKDVASLMGHTTSEMTERYADVVPEYLREQIKKVKFSKSAA